MKNENFFQFRTNNNNNKKKPSTFHSEMKTYGKFYLKGGSSQKCGQIIKG